MLKIPRYLLSLPPQLIQRKYVLGNKLFNKNRFYITFYFKATNIKIRSTKLLQMQYAIYSINISNIFLHLPELITLVA